jgi:hypothetical protein
MGYRFSEPGDDNNWYITALALAASSSNGEYGVDNVDNSWNALMIIDGIIIPLI